MDNSILNLLKKGGFIIYARHGEATAGIDQPYLNLQDCFTQKNLSEVGRREAIYFGQMLRYFQIPISSPIVASPFCRTIETAQLAFPNTYVQIEPFWYEIYKLGGKISINEQTNILSNLQSVLERKPPQGMNQVIIAHSFPVGIGLGKISNMGMVIVKPKGPGNGYEIVKKLTIEDLSRINGQ
ncbi:histidine phosphatase family protein [Lysinibacillus agricola]|uniref:Histidine phosphatase family protein n=1 Tax=Lysinibacillus agricola TaxID=2590012 RepID=A0ABX7AYD6_9BACI|nr:MULTISPECIES: histidine phosphatase family protein [Lysinibacillus]KOS61831.1 phosphoglycerate mutase [Lysinibacillus sp. FJAT-14222]QQP14105.1 histidine phosphatase family protein [Lysinibacillus agricola]